MRFRVQFHPTTVFSHLRKKERKLVVEIYGFGLRIRRLKAAFPETCALVDIRTQTLARHRENTLQDVPTCPKMPTHDIRNKQRRAAQYI